MRWRVGGGAPKKFPYEAGRADGLHVQLAVSQHLNALVYVNMDHVTPSLDGLKGLALRGLNILLDKEMPYYFILIIKQVSDDSYERVGIVRPFHLKRPSSPRDDDHQIVFSDETGKLLDNVELTDNWGEQDWLKGAEEKMVKLK